MTRFYDPKDEDELAWVESLLHQGGIEYFLAAQPGSGTAVQIEVAEEDIPKAEELLIQATKR